MAALNDAPDARLSTEPIVVQHKYGTRTRQNSVMRPSARLRGSPDHSIVQLRTIRPKSTPKTALAPAAPQSASPPTEAPDAIQFPPKGVTLHSEDTNNKVLVAIGRALLSIDNMAVTIKDLSDMVIEQGMQCQGPSAASQAITTYIRSHTRRCEVEQDAPLLLKHTLSGTVADDDLAPSLHSLSGGAQANPVPFGDRRTNFRKGTTVWYLSRTAGAPCPFARVGIRICNYGEHGKRGQETALDPRERRRERDRARRAAQCGEKRKRLTRSCADKADGEESSADEQRPHKVKITLRLKPTPAPSTTSTHSVCASQTPLSPGTVSGPESSDDDSSDDSSDEDEEEESAAVSAPVASVDALQSVFPAPFTSTHDLRLDGYRRSPSAPLSIASAPPDSDDEEEEYHVSITGRRRSISAALSVSDFDDTDDDEGMDWFNDHDGSADEADDEATDYTGRSCVSPVVSPPTDAVARHLEQWEAMDNRVCALASTPIEPPTAIPWIKTEYPTCGQGQLTSPFSFWGGVDNLLSFAANEGSDDIFSPIEVQPDIPFDLESPVEASIPSIATHGQRRSSTWQRAGLSSPYELHAPDLDDIAKSAASGALRILPSSVKSAMATAVPSPTRDMSPPSLDMLAHSWTDSTPSLSSSVSSSVAASPFDSYGSSSSLSCLGDVSSPFASRPEMPKRFSQATIRTLRTEPQTPWEFGLLSPADVDADFQTFFPTDEIKLPENNSHCKPPFELGLSMGVQSDGKMDDVALNELVDVAALREFFTILESEVPTFPQTNDSPSVQMVHGFELDLDATFPEFLAAFATDSEQCLTTTPPVHKTNVLPSQTSDSDMDMEPSSPLSFDAVIPESITPTLTSRQTKAESKLRRSTRLSQKTPKTPNTPQTPRHRTRAQYSR